MIIVVNPGGDPPEEPEEPTGPVVIGPERDVAPLRHTWVGADGSTWNLTDPGGFVSKLRGATGYGFSPVSHAYDESPAIDGSSWGGVRTERGRLFLPVKIRGRDSAHYLETLGKFIRTLDPEQLGRMVVTTPANRSRFAWCRYVDGFDHEVALDPVAATDATYGVGWSIDDGYWHGSDVIVSFVPADPLPFYAPGSQSPPALINVSRADSFEEGTVTNPGHVKSYPRWRVNGPFTGFAVGVGTSFVEMVATRTAGQWIEIDLDPRVLSMVDDAGADRWGSIVDRSSNASNAIPAGEDIPLSMAVTGYGAGSSIELRFPTNYRSAWG